MTRILVILAALLYLALVVLALRPATDLEVARLFFTPPRHFVGNTPGGVELRYAAWALPFVLLAILVVAYALARAGALPPRLAPTGRGLIMMLSVMVIGPGLLVHAGLKEVSHRPRPEAVTQFGGADTFRPWYRFDGACRHNCAFPSGETAAAAWLLAPASLVPPPWFGAAIATALVVTAATAIWRMALGAHFLSDTIGAVLIVVVVVGVLRAALL